MLIEETQKKIVEARLPEALISLSFLRARIAPDLQEAFVEDTRTCLECGSKVTMKEDELVCTSCGRVWSNGFQAEDEKIPIEESEVSSGHAEGSYNPTSALAYGHNLGSYIDGRAFYRIIAKAPEGERDKPLRAQQIKLITWRSEHPTVQNLLTYGSALCAQYVGHTNKESDVVFANELGHQLRRIGAYYLLRGENQGELRRVASATFYMLYAKRSPGDADRVFKELNLTVELLRYVENLFAFLSCPKRKSRQKQTSQNG